MLGDGRIDGVLGAVLDEIEGVGMVTYGEHGAPGGPSGGKVDVVAQHVREAFVLPRSPDASHFLSVLRWNRWLVVWSVIVARMNWIRGVYYTQTYSDGHWGLRT